jgi:hypothetical protein
MTSSLDHKNLCLIVSLHSWVSGVGPVSQPKVVRLLCMVTISFEHVLSNKLHSTLVIQPTASKKISTASLLSTLAKPAEPLQQLSSKDVSDVYSKIVTLLHISNSVTASLDMSSNNSIILKGKREKKRIVMAYQEKTAQSILSWL